jgi:mannose-6-phosphate isomerase-like protein (cupin superfamily)
MLRILPVIALLLLAPAAVRAQAADSVQHLSAGALREAVAAAPGEPERSMVGRIVADRGYTVIALRRTADGEAEIHSEWDDVLVVQEGAATLLHGGTVEGGRETAAGERRGGRIDGGTRQVLAPGDVVLVPAGTPHQVLVPAGGAVRYLAVKVRNGAVASPE